MNFEPGSIVQMSFGGFNLRVLCSYEDYVWALPLPKDRKQQASPLTVAKSMLVDPGNMADAAATDEPA